MKVLKRLIPYARPLYHFWPEYIVYTVLGIIFGLINFALLIPLLRLLFGKEGTTAEVITHKPAFHLSVQYFKDIFHYTFNSVTQDPNKGPFRALLYICIVVAVAVILTNIFRYLAVKTLLRLRLKVMSNLRNELYGVFLKQSLSYHHNNSKGHLLAIMTNEVQEVESSVLMSLQVWLRDPFIVLGYFGMLFYWDYKLTLFTLVFLPLSGYVISSFTKKLKKLNYYSAEVLGDFYTTTEETISGIRQVQSFTAESFLARKFRLLNDAFTRHSKRLAGKKEQASPISEVLGIIAALMLILFGGYLILHGKTKLDGEGFLAYILLYTQIIAPLKNMSNTSINLQRGIIGAEKIFKLIDQPVSIVDRPGAVQKTGFEEELRLDQVSFAYGEKTVLKDVNLRIGKGKLVALVGQSGGGKSTLVDLLSRFYDVKEGSIAVDGTDIRDIRLQDLRKLIGTVSQDTFLFNDTVASNIAFGQPDATEEEIIAAAKIANAHDFIMAMAQGYQTKVGERGVKLSGGQRQRITIARAMLKNPPILILDEATSALDTESERLVQDAINRIMVNRTSIVIAHRLSTVRHADEIIVMEQGEIRERGTHTELLAKGGIYRKLIDLQEVK
jgi:subfamily B ATP-binding cassette protein MsbA